MPELLEQPNVSESKRFHAEDFENSPEPMEVASLGSGLKLTKRVTVEMDHEFCKWLLELTAFDPDRPLDENHVKHLNNAMKRGTFMPEQVMIITCSLDGTEYRMNGQHTAWARWDMPHDYRCPIQHLRYKAETENDMRRLYASIDRLKPRTTGNIIVSYLFGTPEWKGTSRAVLRKMAEGMSFWKWSGKHEQHLHDADDRAFLLMTDHYDLARKVAAFLEASAGKDGRHVQRRPVVAAMFATFSKSANAATEFWSAVRDGVGFGDKHDPRLVLRNGLLSASIAVGAGAAAEKKSVSSEEMFRWSIQAWNAWRNEQPLKLLKAMLSADRPKVA